MKILHLTSSILKEHSISNMLSEEVIHTMQKKYPASTIITRDLGLNPPAHLSLAVATSIRTNEISELTQEQKKEYEAILESIKQLKETDMIVIGAPMYNLSIGSGLKTWIDQICQAGLTFSYTDAGPKGLVNNKPVVIISSRGGIYSEPPANSFDHQEPYLKSILGLIGITDITVIRAEGVNMSEQTKQTSLEKARAAIKNLDI